MYIERVHFNSLRNHVDTSLTLSNGITLLWGDNGAGKTTILEAISLACLSRSFIHGPDRNLIRRGDDGYAVRAGMVSANGNRGQVEIDFSLSGGRKKIRLNNNPLVSAAELIGLFPLVTLSPQYRGITSGPPSERRSFMDMVISQAHPVYVKELFEFRRILRHRNALLGNAEGVISRLDKALDSWDDTYVRVCARILERRRAFLERFVPYVASAYEEIADAGEEPSLVYQSTFDGLEDQCSSTDAMKSRLREHLVHDVRRGTTSLGPHRDDLVLLLNGLDVRHQASQGQVKSFLIALKVAEFRYLQNQTEEVPVLLLDDIFSELDDMRLERVLHLIGRIGQTLITSVNKSTRELLPTIGSQFDVFEVSAGHVRPVVEELV
ncbi:MAG: DNA replication/repair protein RecF [Chlorobi bacterium]|nr:DNA replication/repair protein RecF [Chlorobiota bacterium]